MTKDENLEENAVVRAKISVTVDSELVKWVDEQVKAKRFRNRSHAVEWALARFAEEEKKAGRQPGIRTFSN